MAEQKSALKTLYKNDTNLVTASLFYAFLCAKKFKEGQFSQQNITKNSWVGTRLYNTLTQRDYIDTIPRPDGPKSSKSLLYG